jgi:hypothetical protein
MVLMQTMFSAPMMYFHKSSHIYSILPVHFKIWQQTSPCFLQDDVTLLDKICMMMTRLACNRAIESSYWRMDNNSDVGLLMGYVLYWLPIELESMDLDTFSR